MINFSDSISDELFAAYIDGNTLPYENELIETNLSYDEELNYAKSIVFGSLSDKNILYNNDDSEDTITEDLPHSSDSCPCGDILCEEDDSITIDFQQLSHTDEEEDVEDHEENEEDDGSEE